MKTVLALINILLAAVAIFLGVGLYHKVGQGGESVLDQPVNDPPGAATSTRSPDRSRVRYNAVVDRDLFGTAKSDQGAINPAQLDQLKPTVLKLKLWGTVTGDQDPYAVIGDLKTRQQVLYHIGDSVQNASIKMILRDKVVISTGGKDEVLLLEEATGSAGGPTGPGTAGPAQATPTAPPAMMTASPPIPAPGGPPTAQPPPEAPDLSADEQLTKVGLEPQFGDGQVDGMKINRMAPDSLLKRMGLRPGDVITGFNEQAVTNPADAKALLEELEASGEVQVQIKRQGQQQTIDLKR